MIYINNSFNASVLYNDHMHQINFKVTETASRQKALGLQNASRYYKLHQRVIVHNLLSFQNIQMQKRKCYTY